MMAPELRLSGLQGVRTNYVEGHKAYIRKPLARNTAQGPHDPPDASMPAALDAVSAVRHSYTFEAREEIGPCLPIVRPGSLYGSPASPRRTSRLAPRSSRNAPGKSQNA